MLTKTGVSFYINVYASQLTAFLANNENVIKESKQIKHYSSFAVSAALSLTKFRRGETSD